MSALMRVLGKYRSNTIAWIALLFTVAPVWAGQTITYFHNDFAGSPVMASDSNGNVAWKETYLPFGDRLVESSAAAGNGVWFTGKPEDPTSGLIYMGARYYDPVVGRFMGIDPMAINFGDLYTLNRYAYANNNPFRFVDPTGLSSEPIEGITVTGSRYDLGSWNDTFWSLLRGVGDSMHRNAASAAAMEAREYGEYETYEYLLGVADDLPYGSIDTPRGHLGYDLAPAAQILAGGGAASIVRMGSGVVRAGLQVGRFRLTETLSKEAAEVLTRGRFAGQLARPFQTSPLTIEEIMSAGKGLPDPGGAAGALRWDVQGTFRGSSGTWELVIQDDLILHFNFVTH